MELDVESGFRVENPLHVDNIPVANKVIIEVEGQPVLEPKNSQGYERCEKAWDYIQLCGAIVMLIGMLGGLLLFMIWLYNPHTFGGRNDDN